MTKETLTREQEAFFGECLLEFSDRYTNADIEYKKVYDEGIPPPPIMYPWHGRQKLTAYRNRDRGGYRDRRYDNNSRDNKYRDYDQQNEKRTYGSRYSPY
ncbi:hypothetical protein RN001_008886 [Aquatica leii]|uniref:Uncharacterized protein n=1 Tax=Aquatica leii TaxID=1421715 RepID=A0AAN7SRJ0_9COLE|nr:hypothetical protein RN001_008886 [Aquatica leii]